MCGGPAIKLFSPDELELVVCGSPNLDFKELEAGTTCVPSPYPSPHLSLISLISLLSSSSSYPS